MSMPHVQLTATWTKVKACHDNCVNHMNWTDMGTEYKIVVEHAPFIYVCTITKSDPRGSDQADFEDNYKI